MREPAAVARRLCELLTDVLFAILRGVTPGVLAQADH